MVLHYQRQMGALGSETGGEMISVLFRAANAIDQQFMDRGPLDKRQIHDNGESKVGKKHIASAIFFVITTGF
jgi:hypothetical protein